MKLKNEGTTVGKILLVLLVVSVGRAAVSEFNLTVCRDALYRPGASDSMVHPVAVLVGLGFRLGTSGTLDLKVGYSGYASLVRTLAPIDQGRALRGVRLQATPVFRVAMPIKDAGAFGGVGLALRASYLRQWLRVEPSIYYHYWRDVIALGVEQTFLAGLSYEPSRRFGVDLTLERVGFSLAQDVENEYRNYYPGQDTVYIADYLKTLDVGWRASAPIGVGVGLRLKL